MADNTHAKLKHGSPDSPYDLVVIGGGPGGYVCAIRAGQLGLKTLVVERDALGGVCLNVGCIPSKALIHASKVYYKAKNGAHMGIVANDIAVDMPAMQQWKAGITGKLSGGVGFLLKGNKVEHIAGTARLAGKGVVAIDTADGLVTVRTHHACIATGSTPIQIPSLPFDGETIVDSTGALAFDAVPGKLAVVGGGVIGMELGGVYARLGSEVTVFEAMPRLLMAFDKDLVQPLERKQRKVGVTHLTDTLVQGAEKTDDGRVELSFATKDKKSGELGDAQTDTFDKVLVAVGRRPNSRGIGLETNGVGVDERGFIETNAHRQTSAPWVFAIGDVAGGPQLAHKASYEGEIVAEVVAGHAAQYDAKVIPNVVYTDPEIATVGPSLEELDAAGRKYKAGKYGFAAHGRALGSDATDGFTRVVRDAETDDIIAVHIVGAEAGELINEAGLAIEMGAVVEDLGLVVHAHPTMAEALMEGAKGSLGQAIHAINR